MSGDVMKKFGKGISALVSLWMVGAVGADLITSTKTGVKAGVTSVISRPTNFVAVEFEILDSTGTNQTSFLFQRSSDMVHWSNYSSAVTVTGTISGEITDMLTSTNEFYRMRLINFD